MAGITGTAYSTAGITECQGSWILGRMHHVRVEFSEPFLAAFVNGFSFTLCKIEDGRILVNINENSAIVRNKNAVIAVHGSLFL